MPFMEQQITTKQTWVEVDTGNGITFLPCLDLGTFGLPSEELTDEIKKSLLPYLEVFNIDAIYSAELTTGYGARLSAPGYLDCTEWSVFPTKAEAKAYLTEMYDDDDDEAEKDTSN